MTQSDRQNDPRYSFPLLYSYRDPLAYALNERRIAFRLLNRGRKLGFDASAGIARANRMIWAARQMQVAA